VSAARARIADGSDVSVEWIECEAQRIAETLHSPGPHQAINMTGVILHTGLGRARLAPAVADAVRKAAQNSCTLEIDPSTGERGSRQVHTEELLCELFDAENALVVNNCAGALVLALSALASGREVLVSRGRMVEIGGSFRVPEIVAASGCRLVEVGCTNKTRLEDYQRAINQNTAAILRCHPSNYLQTGFVSSPSPRELAELAKRAGVLMIDDMGTGCPMDLTPFGLPNDRTLAQAVADGSDLVLASGDKLLGGPQAGVILGSSLIKQVASHPLARALRIGKLEIAGLAATLTLWRDERWAEIPCWDCISRPVRLVRKDANLLGRSSPLPTVIAKGVTEIGGGTTPGKGVPTYRVGFKMARPLQGLAVLRSLPVPIFGRVEEEILWLDPRSCSRDEIKPVARALKALEVCRER